MNKIIFLIIAIFSLISASCTTQQYISPSVENKAITEYYEIVEQKTLLSVECVETEDGTHQHIYTYEIKTHMVNDSTQKVVWQHRGTETDYNHYQEGDAIRIMASL